MNSKKPAPFMEKQTQWQNEDIDLIALIERMLLFFGRFKWLLILAMTGGLCIGLLIWKQLPTVYSSRLILHSFTLSNEDLIQVVDNYNRLLKKGEEKELAEALHMNAGSIKKLKQIKASQIQKVFTPQNPNGFFIDVYVTNNSILPELQQGIIYGFENIDYLKKQLQIKKTNFELLIIETQKEISKLDSAKTEVEQSLRTGRSGSNSLMVDISGMNRQLLEMNEKLLNYRQELQFLSAVQVLQGFSSFEKPAGPNLLIWSAAGAIGGLAIGYLLALFTSIRQRISERSTIKPTS